MLLSNTSYYHVYVVTIGLVWIGTQIIEHYKS
jgi:hypothetical protein